MVETTDGDVPISEIEVGDTVIAYDEETGTTGEYTVTDTMEHEDEAIAYVTINGEEIETTPWHLFLTQDGWIEAEDLREGDAIVSLGGVYGTVDSVIIENTVQTMYDLTVEEVHTFAVGDGDWIVHNCTNIDVNGRTYETTDHFWEELNNEGLSEKMVKDAIANGQSFADDIDGRYRYDITIIGDNFDDGYRHGDVFDIRVIVEEGNPPVIITAFEQNG